MATLEAAADVVLEIGLTDKLLIVLVLRHVVTVVALSSAQATMGLQFPVDLLAPLHLLTAMGMRASTWAPTTG